MKTITLLPVQTVYIEELKKGTMTDLNGDYGTLLDIGGRIWTVNIKCGNINYKQK